MSSSPRQKSSFAQKPVPKKARVMGIKDLAKKPLASSNAIAGNPAPDWALRSVFSEARILAWEGTPFPISAITLYPADAALFKSLPTASPANWHRCIHPLDRARAQQHFAKLNG